MKLFAKSLCVAVTALACSAYAAPEISGTVNISNNKASGVRAAGGGGKVGVGPFKFGSVDGAGQTNVNSVILREGKISGNVNITGNEATDIENYGGSEINVNSVVVGR